VFLLPDGTANRDPSTDLSSMRPIICPGMIFVSGIIGFPVETVLCQEWACTETIAPDPCAPVFRTKITVDPEVVERW
jgi:hypothetical protein